MLEIAVIRHGETAWNQEGRLQGHHDIPLTGRGREQALSVAERLAFERWDAIYSSPLVRAAETADLIAKRCGIPKVIRDARLIEKHFGLLEGTTREERIQKWGEHVDFALLGAESAESIVDRGMLFLEELVETYNDHRIVTVTHGGWIRECFQRMFPAQVQGHPFNTSLSKLHYAEGKWTLRLYNCTAHLDC